MSTITRESRTGTRPLFHANPVLSRLSKVTERSDTRAATYRGIAVKTGYFLLVTLVGMVAHLLVKQALAGEPVWQTFELFKKFTVSLGRTEVIVLAAVVLAGFICELVGIFAQRTIPVTGTVYAACQGYFISFLVFKVLTGYEYLGLEALLLTVAVVAVMSWLYTAGIIRAGKKFRTVLLTLLLGSVCVGVLSFLGSLLPATRPFVQSMLQNPAVSIALDVIGLVIAALFLISDFSMIDECVRSGYPKKYEWSAAFGLVFTVIWIYLKILDLLIQITGKNRN